MAEIESREKAQEQRESGEDERRAYRVIGTRPIRHDGADKVTGRALYGADVRLPGMLYGAVLRSPHAHAHIVSIDTSQAEALPGVRAIVTAHDMPRVRDAVADLGETSINLRYQSQNVLAQDKALYYGHPIAAVAAANPHIAEQAVKLIRVEYQVLTPVLDVRQAMSEAAPILLDDLRTDEFGQKGGEHTNVARHIRHQLGDPDRGFHDAAVVVEREFNTATVHQGYIEPQNATALYNVDGQVTIWCSTQGAFGVREQTAELLAIPVARIRVIPMEIGGGFGGKINVYLEPLAVLLSRKAGHRAVKLTMSRSDVLAATGPTSASYIRVKMGADEQGRLIAAEAYLAYEAGAFPGSPVGSGAEVIFAPYNIPNARVDGFDVVVNKPRVAAYRAPGGTNAAFASETVIDELAEKLGMDPLDFRLLNGVKEGDRHADGTAYRRIGCLETLRAVKTGGHYTSVLAGPCRGRGVAAGYWGNYGGKSSVSGSVNADGSVNLVVGSVDIGGSRTSLSMQLAETLGIPVSDVKPMVGDTDAVGYTEGTYGSRTTFASGVAVYRLGQALLAEMARRAALLWDAAPEEVGVADGVFTCGTQQLTFCDLAARLDETGGPISASVSVLPEESGPAFAVHVVDVEVDPETGKVDILRYTAAQDAGTAIYPGYVESQIQGGVAQGIGWGLNEEYVYDEQGRLLNPSLLDYRMPTALDLPMIDPIIVEVPNPGHPYGVRGVGEAPIVPPAAALANAIYRALGVRMSVLPMSPRRILEALWAKEGVGTEGP